MLIDSISNAISTIADKFFPDKNKKLEFQKEVMTSINKLNLAQLEINKNEAKHKSLFVAGWRPAVGWLCVFCLAYVWILRDFLILLLIYINKDLVQYLPKIDAGQILTLILGMLGMGGLRTFEKSKLIAREK